MARFILAVLFALATAAPAFAQEGKQPPGGRGITAGMPGSYGAFFIEDLRMKEVQEDLKLTADEKAKIGSLMDVLKSGDKLFAELNQGVAREEMKEKNLARQAEVEKLVKDVLGDKYARFRQIRLQLNGAFSSVLRDPEVRQKLELTGDQRSQLLEATQGGTGFQAGATLEKYREAVVEMQKKQAETIERVLTAKQKKKWKEMIGPKVNFKRRLHQAGPGERRTDGGKEPAKKPPTD